MAFGRLGKMQLRLGQGLFINPTMWCKYASPHRRYIVLIKYPLIFLLQTIETERVWNTDFITKGATLC